MTQVDRDTDSDEGTPINLDDIPYSDGLEITPDLSSAIPIDPKTLPRERDSGALFYNREIKNEELFQDICDYAWLAKKMFTVNDLVGQCPSIAKRKLSGQKIRLFDFLSEAKEWLPKGYSQAKSAKIHKKAHGWYSVEFIAWPPGESERRIGPKDRRRA